MHDALLERVDLLVGQAERLGDGVDADGQVVGQRALHGSQGKAGPRDGGPSQAAG